VPAPSSGAATDFGSTGGNAGAALPAPAPQPSPTPRSRSRSRFAAFLPPRPATGPAVGDSGMGAELSAADWQAAAQVGPHAGVVRAARETLRRSSGSGSTDGAGTGGIEASRGAVADNPTRSTGSAVSLPPARAADAADTSAASAGSAESSLAATSTADASRAPPGDGSQSSLEQDMQPFATAAADAAESAGQRWALSMPPLMLWQPTATGTVPFRVSVAVRRAKASTGAGTQVPRRPMCRLNPRQDCHRRWILRHPLTCPLLLSRLSSRCCQWLTPQRLPASSGS